MQTFDHIFRCGKYYSRFLFSRNKACFYSARLGCSVNESKTSNFCLRLIDKEATDLSEIVSRAVAALQASKQLATDEALRAIIQMDALMCLVSENENIVACEWFTPCMHYLPWLKAFVHLSDGEIYEHGIFVKESHRRKGILNLMRVWAYERLADRDFARVINAVMSWNIPSLKSNDRFGFRAMGQVIYGHVVGCRYCISTMPENRLSYRGQMVLRRPFSRKEAVYGQACKER